MPIPAKFLSVRSIFVMMRDQGTGALTYFPFSCVLYNIKDYYFRIGSTVTSPKAPSKIPEKFAELIKAIGSLSDINHQPSIELTRYSAAESTPCAIGRSNFWYYKQWFFYIGLDLENYVNGNQKDLLFTGYNSTTDDIVCVIDTVGIATTILRFDAFAMIDCVSMSK